MTPNAAARTLAVSAFAAHVSLVLFSTAAMLTILAGPPSPWLAQEPNATVMRVAFRFSGPTYVVLGGLAALAHAAWGTRWTTALRLAATAMVLSLGIELAGTGIGLPFGEYHYTTRLGALVLGLVPFAIPVSWFTMVVASLAIVSRLRPARDDSAGRWRWAVFAGLLLVAWDVAMDPAMVRTGHWVWGSGDAFRDAGLPSWTVAFFTRDVFHGMPLSNWLGWLLTGTLIARVMLAIVPPARYSAGIGRSRLPVLLYLVNGVMPVAICARDGLWWAAMLGATAMLLPAIPALGPARSERKASPALRASTA